MKTLLALLSLTVLALAALPVVSAHTIDPIFPKCVVASDQPDMGEKVCVNPSDPSCTVYEVRTTFLGTTKTCLYPSGGCGNNCASATPSSVNCYEVYSRTNVGTYSVVRRTSCSAPEVYTCPYEGAPISQCQSLVGSLLRPASASGPIGCMPVYSRTDVGTYSVVRRDSCAPPEAYVCPYEGAPIDQCQDLLQASASSAVGLPRPPPMECYDIYSRHDIGPVAVVMTSSCSGHVETCHKAVGVDQTDLSCVLAAIKTSSSQQQCLEYYSDWSIGPVHHHQTDSCNAQNYVCEQSAGDLVNHGFDAAQCDLGLAASSGAPVDPLARRCSSSGQGEFRTTYCIDPKSRDCTLYEQRVTGVGSEWWCYPSGQHGSDY